MCRFISSSGRIMFSLRFAMMKIEPARHEDHDQNAKRERQDSRVNGG
jgi:hypothetical protein